MPSTAATLPDSYQVLLDFALGLATESAALVLPYYRKPLQIEDKNIGTAAGSPTAADWI